MEEDSYGFLSLDDAKQYLIENYPDKMVLDNMDEFERVKLAGKVELAQELLSKMEV